MRREEFTNQFHRCVHPKEQTHDEMAQKWAEAFQRPVEELAPDRGRILRSILQAMDAAGFAHCLREWLGEDATACLLVKVGDVVVHVATEVPALGLVLDELGVHRMGEFQIECAILAGGRITIERAPDGWLQATAQPDGAHAGLVERLNTSLPPAVAIEALGEIADGRVGLALFAIVRR